MTEDDIRSLLREMKDEPVPADSLARVRMGVASATAAKRTIWWRFFAAVAVACAVLVAVVFLRPANRRSTPPLTARVAQPVAAPESRPVTTTPLRATASAKRRRLVPQPANVVDVVRIETADPDVVILLLGD